jgi:hypothetical protein
VSLLHLLFDLSTAQRRSDFVAVVATDAMWEVVVARRARSSYLADYSMVTAVALTQAVDVFAASFPSSVMLLPPTISKRGYSSSEKRMVLRAQSGRQLEFEGIAALEVLLVVALIVSPSLDSNQAGLNVVDALLSTC